MSITSRYATNMALQYNNSNEVVLKEYIMNNSRGSGKFLTESPAIRLLSGDQNEALYFISDGFTGAVLYQYYNSAGTLLNSEMLAVSGVHVAIPIRYGYVPAGTFRVIVKLISSADMITNGDLTLGSGDTFTSWNKNVSGSTITQNATGSVDGGRAVSFNTSASGGTFTQFTQTGLGFVNGVNYTLEFWAKEVTASAGTMDLNDGISGGRFGSQSLTTDWTRYTKTFTWLTGWGTQLTFETSNNFGANNVLLDKIRLYRTGYSNNSETRTYLIDDSCSEYEKEVNWLNKLGGRDSYVFKGYPILEKGVQRNNLIELSKLSNFVSPKRIYGYRENISREAYTLFHKCENEQIAIWLRDELIDSIDVMLRVGDYYYPVNCVEASIVTQNTFVKDFVVRFKFQFAFDVNIQTR